MEVGITSRLPIETPRATIRPSSPARTEATPELAAEEPMKAPDQATVDGKGLEALMAEMVKVVNEKIASWTVGGTVQFEIDSKTGSTVILVVDQTTDEIIRRIPPEEMLALQEHIAEMRGLLFDRKG